MNSFLRVMHTGKITLDTSLDVAMSEDPTSS